MGPKGSPRKSMSVPATMTRIPADAIVQKLGLVDGDDLRRWVDLFGELHGVGHGLGVDLPAVVGRDLELAGAARFHVSAGVAGSWNCASGV